MHALSGAMEKNPSRFRDRAAEPTDDRPLGPPPEFLEASQRAAWLEIERLAPWLCHADRLAVEIASVLIAKFRLAGDMTPPAIFSRLEAALGQLGLTPASRSKVTMRQSGKDNPFSRHGGKPAAGI